MARWNSANRSRYYHLFCKIADLGHIIIVVQPPPRLSEETNYIDLPFESHPNIHLHTVKMFPWIWNIKFPMDKFFKKALYTISSYFLVRRLVYECKPDALVVYNLPQYLYMFGIATPVVLDFADDYMAMLQHEMNISDQNILSKMGSFVFERLIRKSILIVSVSEILSSRVKHKNKLLLPNGADLSVQNGEQETPHINRNRPVIGYVGAFEYFIDLELMLVVAKRFPNFTFLYVGAGREFPRVKERVANDQMGNVILTGAVSHRQAMQFISEMDICLNLFTKGMVSDAASPIKLFEYVASGKPVITTRLVETQRLSSEISCLYFADTIDELADTIALILKNPEETAQRVVRSKEFVREHYNWSSLAAKFIVALETTLAKETSCAQRKS